MNNEPVAWMKSNGEVSVTQGKAFCIPLYTHPSKHDLGIAEAIGFDKGYKAATAKTLTDEEILELADKHIISETKDIGMGDCIAVTEGEIDFARAILKKASEK